MHKAAQRGLAIAQEQLALMLARGRGGVVDVAAARLWHRRAAEQGHEPSRLALAALPPG
ncbi:MAG: Sel1 repeat [Pseudomonadota bacterium]